MLQAKYALILIGGFPGGYLVKCYQVVSFSVSPPLTAWHIFFFLFDGFWSRHYWKQPCLSGPASKGPSRSQLKAGRSGAQGEELSESCRVWRTKELVYSSAPHRHPSQLSTGSIRAGSTHFKQAPDEESSSGSILQKVHMEQKNKIKPFWAQL